MGAKESAVILRLISADEAFDVLVAQSQQRNVKLRDLAARFLSDIVNGADALELVGDKWSLLVIREIGLGVPRFEGIRTQTGAPRQILTARLRKLETVGVIERRQYSDHPPRHEYVLTKAGEQLLPVLANLREWGEQFAPQRL
jgi:DNA-binding HxlR family transcriptional regulator